MKLHGLERNIQNTLDKEWNRGRKLAIKKQLQRDALID
jgi:hypothetical protein